MNSNFFVRETICWKEEIQIPIKLTTRLKYPLMRLSRRRDMVDDDEDEFGDVRRLFNNEIDEFDCVGVVLSD